MRERPPKFTDTHRFKRPYTPAINSDIRRSSHIGTKPMTEENAALQLRELAKTAGRYEAMNDVLRWATEHAPELRSAGLMESLVALCTKGIR